MGYKKISELSGITSPNLSGVTVVVDNGTTYKSTLHNLRNTLVDSGSHYFTGSQTINGNLTINNSSFFGNSFDDNHIFSGSLKLTGSMLVSGSITTNGYTILSNTTSSFINDTDAAANGVPLQGLYRSGSFIMIRLT